MPLELWSQRSGPVCHSSSACNKSKEIATSRKRQRLAIAVKVQKRDTQVIHVQTRTCDHGMNTCEEQKLASMPPPLPEGES